MHEQIGKALPPPATALWINHLHRVTGLFGTIVELATFAGSFFGYDVAKMMTQKTDTLIKQTFEQAGFPVLKVIPRVKESGDYIYFQNKEEATKAMEFILAKDFQGRSVDAYIVVGEPFLEDIVFLRPSAKLRIVFPDSVKITEDSVFNLFRPYGKIQEIKVEKNVAEIVYLLKSDAISARNCKFRYRDPSWTTGAIDVHYSPYSRWKLPRVVALFNNPKLIPLWALLAAVVLLMLLEPIRLFNVIKTIAATWWEEGNMPDFNMREQDEENLHELLIGPPTAVLMVNGPRGSGKSVLARRLVQHEAYAVRINCSSETISQTTIEGALVDSLEKAIGFWPSFSAVNKLFMWVESMLPSKTSLQSTKVVQLDNILRTTHNALRFINLFSLNRRNTKTPVIIFDRFHDLMDGLNKASPQERKDAEILIQGLLKWCVMINNKKLAHIVVIGDQATEEKLRSMNPHLAGKILHYDLEDITKETAIEFLHRILKVEGASTPPNAPPQAQEMPEPPKAVKGEGGGGGGKRGVGDLTISFFDVLRGLSRGKFLFNEEKDDTVVVVEGTASRDAFERAYRVVGGRPADLQMLTVYLERGTTLHEAIDELILETKSGILASGFGKQFQVNTTPGSWSKTQLWKVIGLLAKEPKPIPADQVVQTIFKGNYELLSALVDEELIEIQVDNDRQMVTSSPLFRHCYSQLLDDAAMQGHLERLLKESQIADIKKEIVAIEEELKVLALLQRGDGYQQRLAFLDRQLAEWQGKMKALNP